MNFYNFDRVGPSRFQERFGLDFEDFRGGQRFLHRPGVTVTQQDNLDESLDTMNSAMLHYDANYAGKTAWTRPLLVSTITLQRAIGMASVTFGRKRRIPAFHEIAMTAPVFGGDTLYADSEVIAADPGSHPDGGVLKVKTCMARADGTRVASLSYDIEVYRCGRYPGAPAAAEPAAEPRFAAFREQADGALLEQYGLFFEDAQPGDTFVHFPRRTLTRDEAIEHSRRSFDWTPQFHDAAWIDAHQGGRYRIAEPWLISAVTAATTRTFGRVVANLGWTDIQLPVPVFHRWVRSKSHRRATRWRRNRPLWKSASRNHARARASSPSIRGPTINGGSRCFRIGVGCWCTSAMPTRRTPRPGTRDRA